MKIKASSAWKIIIVLTLFAILIVIVVSGWIDIGNSGPCEAINDSIHKETRDAEKPLRVAIFKGAGFAGGIIANNGLVPSEDSLFYKKYGIFVDFKIIEDRNECLKAFKNYDVDIIWSTSAEFAFHYSNLSSLNPVAFLQYCWSRGDELLAADSSVQGISGLSGRTLACRKGGAAHFLALYMIRLNNIKADNLKWEFTKNSLDAVDQLNNGKADACAVDHSAYSTRIKGHKKKILFSTGEASNLIAGIFLARESYIILNREILEKFVLGWFEGVKIAREKQEAAKILSGSFKLDKKLLEAKLQRCAVTDYQDNSRFFELNGDSFIGFNDLFELSLSIWNNRKQECRIDSANLAKNTDILVNISEQVSKNKKKILSGAPVYQKINETEKKPPVDLTKKFSVFFNRGISIIDFKAGSSLREIAGIASILNRANIHISGFADNRESNPDYLSGSREQSVIKFLLSEFGIQAGRFILSSSSKSPEGKGSSRRVEIKFVSSKD